MPSIRRRVPRLAAPALAALCATAAPAEETRPFADLAPGAGYAYRFLSGQVMRMELAERDENGSAWRVLSGEGDAAREVGELRYDADGRVTAFLPAGDAPPETYDPHNCERVVGLCEYTVTRGDQSWSERRISGVSDGVWTFSVFRVLGGEHELQKVGSVTYDDDGVVVDELWMDGATGEERGARRIE